MELFIGTQLVLAKPMTRGEYNKYRDWFPLKDENPDDEGYLIEYDNGKHPNHDAHQGYITWLAKDMFQLNFRPNTNLNFGQALEALKLYKKVARSGWNGKGMFIYYVGPGRYPPTTPTGKEIAKGQEDNHVPYLAYIAMKTVSGEVVPWLASQTDILADDWEIVQ